MRRHDLWHGASRRRRPQCARQNLRHASLTLKRSLGNIPSYEVFRRPCSYMLALMMRIAQEGVGDLPSVQNCPLSMVP